MTEEVRVRFAPSPTGDLHIGGARTALFNWLFARHHGGKFILRIEDTDLARSTKAATAAILEGLSWLGLDWDEGPYYQMDSLSRCTEAAAALLASGKAYECFCLPEDLQARREEAQRQKRQYRYDRSCLELTTEAKVELRRQGRVPVVRFRVPESMEIKIRDLIRGEVTFGSEVLGDMIIVRPDGVPTYNFAVVVDDHHMGITHVIRGEDHLSNTPKQIMLYEALGYDVPVFGHLPMILGKDKARLSKRHGATSVVAYRDQGYLPEAVVNYLALLGWSLDDKSTILARETIIREFGLERVGKAAAVFDTDKLNWMNGMYIRAMEPEDLLTAVIPFWLAAGLISVEQVESQTSRLLEIVKICAERLTLLGDIVQLSDFFFREPVYESASVAKVLRKEGAAEALVAVGEALKGLADWTPTGIEGTLRGLAQRLELKPGKLFQPIRVAVSGKSVSPPLFESLWIIGKDASLGRIAYACAL